MDFKWDIIYGYAPLFLKGTLITIGISLLSIFLGSILGLVVSLCKMSKHWFLRWPTELYVNFFRGTPLFVQILIIHFGVVRAVLGHTDAIIAAITALTLNSAAYSAEIFRAGIQSIDRGQREAAYSLGLSRFQTMRFVILPQAIKRMIPPFGNEFITLIKDSSLVSIIAAPEIMYWASSMNGQYLRIWEPYLTAAFIYLALTYSLSKLLQVVERRLDKA